MHRTIEITVPPSGTDMLLRQLNGIEHVVGLSVQRGTSVKPPGDVVQVHVLNRGADAVMRAAGEAQAHGPVSVATAELASLSDAEHQESIDRDVDEAIWEELEAGLRHQGRVTSNYLSLMALGGAIAAAGLVTPDPVHQAIAFVAAAVVAPGFEPVAKVPLGLVLRRGQVVKRGLVSSLAGYAVLALAAAATFALLWATGAATVEAFAANPAVKSLAQPKGTDLLVSACGALAGVVMQAAFRRSVIAGALMAMRMIEATAATGIALAVGRPDLAWQGAERLAIDIAFIIAAGLAVFWLKQAFVHRRPALH